MGDDRRPEPAAFREKPVDYASRSADVPALAVLWAAIIAHVVTNLGLGLIVVLCDRWQFW